MDPTGPFNLIQFTLNDYELIILLKLTFKVSHPAKSILLR